MLPRHGAPIRKVYKASQRRPCIQVLCSYLCQPRASASTADKFLSGQWRPVLDVELWRWNLLKKPDTVPCQPLAWQ